MKNPTCPFQLLGLSLQSTTISPRAGLSTCTPTVSQLRAVSLPDRSLPVILHTQLANALHQGVSSFVTQLCPISLKYLRTSGLCCLPTISLMPYCDIAFSIVVIITFRYR